MKKQIKVYRGFADFYFTTTTVAETVTQLPKDQVGCGGVPEWKGEIDLVAMLETPQCEW